MRIDLKKALTDPRPNQIERVVYLSQSNDFDEAKKEWELANAIDETAEGFTNVCGLCNNPHLRHNFIIHNPLTSQILHVGSTCIIRFGLIQGNVDYESGKAILNNFMKEKSLLDEIRGLSGAVMVAAPDYILLNNFVKALRSYFEGKGISSPTKEQLGEAAFGNRRDEYFSNPNNTLWLMRIWESPDSIPVIKTQTVAKLPVFKEGTTWKGKQRRGAFISDTFGRSSEYNVERHVEKKNSKK